MSLSKYIIYKLLKAIPLLLLITFVSFLLIQFSPSDPAEVAIRVNALTPTPELIAETRREMGLDKPFMERYATWLVNAMHGDFGKRFVDGKPVAEEIAKALPPTLLLAFVAAIVLLLTSVPAAVIGALYEGRMPDILLRLLIFFTTSFPAFWAGLLLMWLFAVHWDLLPLGGLETPASLVLPAITLALPFIAAYTRLLRGSIIQTSQENFVIYERTCGMRPLSIFRHIFRNSLQSSLTGLGISLPKLIAGTFVVQCIFAWPGLGRLCVTSIFNRDFPVIQAYMLVMAIFFYLFNLFMEVIAAIVDPRLRERIEK